MRQDTVHEYLKELTGDSYPDISNLVIDISNAAVPKLESAGSLLMVVLTKATPWRLIETLPHTLAERYPILILDDSPEPAFPTIPEMEARSHPIFYHSRVEQEALFRECRYLARVSMLPRLGQQAWRLGSCRNYALILASLSGYAKVLILDDDIIPEKGVCSAACALLSEYPIVGAATIGMPDDSVVGHILRKRASVVSSFVSGQFLGVTLPSVRYHFPDIYNEDWIFVALHAAGGSVARFGAVRQLPYDAIPEDVSRAEFQERGEILVQGILETVLGGQGLVNLRHASYWAGIRTKRIRLLDSLRELERNEGKPDGSLANLNASRSVALRAEPAELARLVRAYLDSASGWRRLLERTWGQMPRSLQLLESVR